MPPLDTEALTHHVNVNAFFSIYNDELRNC